MSSLHPRSCKVERRRSWPMSIGSMGFEVKNHPTKESGSMSAAAHGESTHHSFLDDLDNNPDQHFLAPVHMYEYEDWASDSEDEDVVDWDAGITDFALFDWERKQAQNGNQPLPPKWNEMLDNQTSALERSLNRTRAGSNPDSQKSQVLDIDDLPSLTPDNSPGLRDDLDIESYHGQRESRPSVPNYLAVDITPRKETTNNRGTNEEDDQPRLSTAGERHEQSQRRPQPPRPGLTHSRTMSGQVHAWRRPSADIYTVGEEPESERRAELRMTDHNENGDDDGGRGRHRSRK